MRPYEILWHGRGGQGAVTAAKIVAQSAYLEGYRGVTATPFFGAERRGVPVIAATRISPEPIMVFSQVERPDVVVVLDHTMLKSQDTAGSLQRGGWLVVNASQEPKGLGVRDDINIATVDATAICQKLGLVIAGLTVVNTAMLGAFVRATEMVGTATLGEVIRERFSEKTAALNIAAMEKTYETTRLEKTD